MKRNAVAPGFSLGESSAEPRLKPGATNVNFIRGSARPYETAPI